MEKDIDKTVENVDKMVDGFESKMASLEAKMEEMLKIKASFDKDQVDSAEESKKKSKYYGYVNARKDIANGKNSSAAMWDEETETKFVEYVQMVKEGDKAAIKKAYGDSPYTSTTGAGGYMIPDEFRPELVRLAYRRSLMLPKVRVIPMTSDTLNMIGVTGGTVSWGSINTRITDSKLTLTQPQLTAEKLVGLSIVPNELLADSALPIGTFLADEFSEAFASKIDEEILQGDADDSTNHKFDGWGYADNVTAMISADVDASPTFAEEVTAANLIAGVAAVQAVDERNLDGAEWFVHPTVWAVIRGLTDSNGDHLVSIDRNFEYNLLGFPVNVTAKAPAGGSPTAGAPYLLFGNPNNIYVGDRMSFDLQSSSESRFSYDQTEFRAIQRLGVLVAKPTAIGRFNFGAAS